MDEARLEERPEGRVPVSEGWFVVNVRDAAWVGREGLGFACVFEGAEARFPEFGINLHVLQPGEPNSMYHAESNQEAFLVLSGECLLLAEEEERRLGAWDFVHCPPNARHVFVGAGEGPCVILMVGTRDEDEEILYPVSELALRHGAGVERETPDPKEAYRRFTSGGPGRPPGWDQLPWARPR